MKKSKPPIRAVKTLAKQYLPKSRLKLAEQFLDLYYRYADASHLSACTAETLYEIAMSHLDLILNRSKRHATVRVFNPTQEDDGWESRHTCIQIVSNDMPFIVDSCRMELNRLGLTVHLQVCMGGMSVERDSKNKVVNILEHSDGEVEDVESPIYFEVDQVRDTTALKEVQTNLLRVMADVKNAVEDWEPMRRKVECIAKELHSGNLPKGINNVDESMDFLHWLSDDHFTFLGLRDYKITGSGSELALDLVKGASLGVLKHAKGSKLHRPFAELPEKVRELMLNKNELIIIAKTNTISTVHRPVHTDYVAVKRFSSRGKLIGVRCIIGLYTSTAYSTRTTEVPFIRHKVAYVLKRANLPGTSYAGKDLIHILETLPRDDLFQASRTELYKLSMDILNLQERNQLRLFVRKDAYNRYVSCLVYVPRERFNVQVLREFERILMDAFSGLHVTFNTHISESVLARIHYVIRIDPKRKIRCRLTAVEDQLVEASKSWDDRLRELLNARDSEFETRSLLAKYGGAFPAGYCDGFTPEDAAEDIAQMEAIHDVTQLGIMFHYPKQQRENTICLKLYHQSEMIALSDVLPMLENMGMRVIGEQSFWIKKQDQVSIWVNDFLLEYDDCDTLVKKNTCELFQEAFYQIWSGMVENDPLNALVLRAGLTWKEVGVLRSYAKYLKQTHFVYSQEYIAETLVTQVDLVAMLMEIFRTRFSPKKTKTAKAKCKKLKTTLLERLESVASLDHDRILRRFLELIFATLRTNYFQTQRPADHAYFAFKLQPSLISDMPSPVPMYEIFVHSVRFEGTHLRTEKIARGGLRWSDRREDYRTEILGLMKAQRVKNAVIVPAGAKGGFVLKSLPATASRDEVLAEGIACYQFFIAALLDLVDNRVGGKIQSPPKTVCYDDADPYLVVAADKGTATFSDRANAIAVERGYWLQDAFASGGSSGYDHKKMGITARGAWVSAERQFQELGVNVDNVPIRVVAIGDMAGDVFGNGMLLSKHIQLVAAFNHQHIFIDPHPDPLKSFEERKRLFELPRSSWADYDVKLLSRGGGIYSRHEKYIKITETIRRLLRIDSERLEPNELIRAILSAPVDLLWNGGIGTYVKASWEANADVGDRVNDALRINAPAVQAKVVCEGGNLGFTQLARVECALAGVKVNTDFIDNVSGVDCSDHEVNIKILLNEVAKSGKLTLKERNKLLSRMTNDVANLVLQNNYHQNRVLSVLAHHSSTNMPLYMNYIDFIERHYGLSRELAGLPDNEALLERKNAGKGLTKPELAVLMSHTNSYISERMQQAKILNDRYFEQFLLQAFPTQLHGKYQKAMLKHWLRQPIIANQLGNQLVFDMGITFCYQMYDETGCTLDEIISAYLSVREIFNVSALFADIECLDYQVGANVQYMMTDIVMTFVRRCVRWFLKNYRIKSIHEAVNTFSPVVKQLRHAVFKWLSGYQKRIYETERDALLDKNVQESVAAGVMSTRLSYHFLNIAKLAEQVKTDVSQIAKMYFVVMNRFNLMWFRDCLNAFPVNDRWTVLMKGSYKNDLDEIHQRLTLALLKFAQTEPGSACMKHWFKQHEALLEGWNQVIQEIKSEKSPNFTLFAAGMRELTDLAKTL